MKQISFRLILSVLTIVALEVLGQVAYRLRAPDHRWLFQQSNPDLLVFQPHPFLGRVGIPHATAVVDGVKISLNSLGYRGHEVRPKNNGVTRVVTVGGSTTYGLGVSDDATWPAQLERALGGEFDILNLGMDGYSTVENIVQTAFGFSDVAPTVAIYFLGWNDLHSSHVVDLDPYYASFHGRMQQDTFGFRRPLYSALRYNAGLLVDGREKPPPLPTGRADHPLVDSRALALYRRNLHSIAALCRSQHVQPIFVPAVFDCKRLAADTKRNAWSPFVKNSELCALASVYADTMADVAHQQSLRFVTEVRTADAFQAADFIDIGHFSPSGNAKLAKLLAPIVRTIKGD